MGVGKTTACRALQQLLPRNVFLDGDWCWDMRPFVVNDETKAMVLGNIHALLGAFLRCGELENIIFCWVMDEQSIVDSVLAGLPLDGCRVHCLSLVCSEAALRERLTADVAAGRREPDVIARSLARLPKFARLDGLRLDVSALTPDETAREIVRLCRGG